MPKMKYGTIACRVSGYMSGYYCDSCGYFNNRDEPPCEQRQRAKTEYHTHSLLAGLDTSIADRFPADDPRLHAG